MNEMCPEGEAWLSKVLKVSEEIEEKKNELAFLKRQYYLAGWGAEPGAIVIHDGKPFKVTVVKPNWLGFDKRPHVLAVPLRADGVTWSLREIHLYDKWRLADA